MTDPMDFADPLRLAESCEDSFFDLEIDEDDDADAPAWALAAALDRPAQGAR